MSKIDDLDFENLEVLSDEELAKIYVDIGDTSQAVEPAEVKKWVPPLTPKQLEVFYDTSPNLLLQSSRFTGKSYAVAYAAVKHCYDYKNALVLLVTRTKRQAMAGGLMSKMISEILPDYKNNITDFEWDGPKVSVEKDLLVRVKSRFGTWNVIQLMSITNDNDLQRKIKGLEASLIVVDEITVFESSEIYRQLSATLGRRSHIPPEAQRFIGTCNPAGPTSWVAETWSVMDESARDPAFRVIKFLPEDNPVPSVKAYYDRLKQALRHNPTQYKRDIEGLWVDVPQGDAIFKDYFVPEFHVRGDLKTMEFLQPQPGLSVSIGWDPGDVNHGVIFLQEIPTKERMVWIAFDEVVFVDKKVNLEQLTREVLARMQHWSEQLEVTPQFNHVSDRSAFDRFRAATGSYDFLEIERHAKTHLPKYPKLVRAPRIVECPKPAGSVEARMRIVMDMLSNQELFISAKCVNLVDSLKHITPKKDSPFSPDTKSPYKHALDAMTYPLFYYKTGGVVTGRDEHPDLKPQITRVGA